jgi:sec-independent protein translocase protein TatC
MSFGSERARLIGAAAGHTINAVANRREDGEDLFAHTRMSLGDHIEELRRHMIKALIGFFIGMIIGFFISGPIVEQIAAPIERGLMHLYHNRLDKVADERVKLEEAYQNQLAARKIARANHIPPLPDEGGPHLDVKVPKHDLANAIGVSTENLPNEMTTLTFQIDPIQLYGINESAQGIVKPPRLSSLNVTEVFMVYLKVAMYAGIVISSPWIFYQMWMFIAAGLYPHERRYVHMYMPISLGLFLCGVALCWFVVLPLGITYLLGWNDYMGIEADLRLNEWLGFAIMMPVIFGAAFQLPLVMLFLERLGIVDAAFYIKHWRIAVFVIMLVGGLLAVSPDPISMFLLGGPMLALYGIGILMCKYMPRHQVDDLDVPQSEELIEV